MKNIFRRLYKKGYSNAGIAHALYISVDALKNQRDPHICPDWLQKRIQKLEKRVIGQ